ncbi:MAG: UbiD family decarboxylase [Candidatus Aenigmatarchaeota archaeon]
MNMREFVDLLDKKGLLVKVKKPVDTKYEISTIVKMLAGKPVLFEHVKGHDMPVVSNVCSTRDLVCLGLDIDKKDLIAKLTHAIENPAEPTKKVSHEYHELECDLSKLPILTYYPKDGGPYIASGIAVAKDAEHGVNASYHRAMILGKDRMVLRILERHLNEYKKRGLKEFAFCIGNPTTVLIGAAISAELGKNELAIANALNETNVIELNGHVVPESEIVMICEFTGDVADEGPFLDLTETFDIVRKQSVVRVKKIYAKKNAIFHALLPGDLEHKILMGMPREPTIFREVAKVCDCRDVYITPGGCSWLHGAVKIHKKHEDDGRKAIEAAFKGHASMKHVFVVDDDINIEEPKEIEWALATRFQGDKNMVVKTKEKGSSLDPSSDMATRETTKVGFDLTKPLVSKGKDFSRPELPMKINLDDYLVE